MSRISSYFISFAVTLIFLRISKAQQSYCWDPCQTECEQKSPRLCPAETILTYYECCLDGCCPCIKWSNLLFLMFITILLLTGCCCCTFFLLTDSRQRMFQKQQQMESNRQKSGNGKKGQSTEEKKERDGTGFKHKKKYSTTIV